MRKRDPKTCYNPGSPLIHNPQLRRCPNVSLSATGPRNYGFFARAKPSQNDCLGPRSIWLDLHCTWNRARETRSASCLALEDDMINASWLYGRACISNSIARIIISAFEFLQNDVFHQL